MKTCDRCGSNSESAARSCRVCGADLSGSLIGAVLGQRYRIESLLGAGGMGRVYRAVHVVLGKPFAVKVLAPEFAHDQVMLQRFRREALAASRLAHPNVVTTVDFGIEGTRAYSVMELVEGQSLDTLLARTGPIALLRALEFGRQTALALGAAHRAGIVHRDVKPGNIIIGEVSGRDHVVVVDFGLAVLRSMSTGNTGRLARYRPGGGPASTAPGVALGTPAYVSPEQVMGRTVDARADVYGLGAVLYEMVTGTPPFGFGDPSSLTLKHAYEQPLPPSARPGVGLLPDAFEDAIMRMLDKRPGVRPSDGDAAAELLATILAELSTPIAIPTSERRERAIVVMRLSDQPDLECSLSEQVALLVRACGGQLARAVGEELIAHFDEAEAALQAGIRLRDEVVQPPAIAVHHGEIELGLGGGMFGAPVNLALRLARLAVPGELIASSDVYEMAGVGIRSQLAAGGLLHLGGKSQPIPVYRVGDLSRRDGAITVPAVIGVIRGDRGVEFVCECGARGSIEFIDVEPRIAIRSRCRDCSRQLSILPRRVDAVANDGEPASGHLAASEAGGGDSMSGGAVHGNAVNGNALDGDAVPRVIASDIIEPPRLTVDDDRDDQPVLDELASFEG